MGQLANSIRLTCQKLKRNLKFSENISDWFSKGWETLNVFFSIFEYLAFSISCYVSLISVVRPYGKLCTIFFLIAPSFESTFSNPISMGQISLWHWHMLCGYSLDAMQAGIRYVEILPNSLTGVRSIPNFARSECALSLPLALVLHFLKRHCFISSITRTCVVDETAMITVSIKTVEGPLYIDGLIVSTVDGELSSLTSKLLNCVWKKSERTQV